MKSYKDLSRYSTKKSKVETKPRLRKKVKVVRESFTEDGRKLARIYIAVRNIINGIDIKLEYLERKWARSLNKLAQDIIDYETHTGIKVDRIRFVRAHFEHFGKDTYPTHMMNGSRFSIYRKFTESAKAFLKPCKSLNDFSEQFELLEYLSDVRQEPRHVVINLLPNIFTDKFRKDLEEAEQMYSDDQERHP